MLELFRQRSLSNINLWPNYNVCYLCCVIVLILNTFQLVYSDNDSTASQCQCNSTTTGPSSLNATGTIHCNCTQDTINCKTGYQFLNGTCVRCFCNSTTKPINCNCSDIQTPQNKICSPGQFLSNSSQQCINCSCNVHTSLNNNCNNRTGQCFCQENVTGQRCTICAANYTANYSSSGELLNCFEQCPTGFKRTERNECIKANSTSSLPSTPVMSSTHGIIVSTDSMVPTSISSTPVLTSLSTEVPSSLPSSPKTPSTYLVPSSNSPIPTTPSPSITITQSTGKSPSIQTPSPTIESSSSSPPPPPPPSSSPPSSPSPSPPPSTTTGKPTSTNTPPTSANTPTTDHVPTTGQESSPKPGTDKPSSEKPTTKVHHTKMPSKDDSSDTVVIVLTCLGVVAILAIAIAVGCYCLRAKRKPSTPFWTVELSNTRNNEELDFALLDPVTDEPHKKANDTSEADASITEHSRYYAYI